MPLSQPDSRGGPLSRRRFLRLASIGAGLSLPALAGVSSTLAAQGAPGPVPAQAPRLTSPIPTPSILRPDATPTAIFPGAAPTPVTIPPGPPPAPAATWVQALRPIALWSGPDEEAIQLGTAARWDYFQVVRGQEARLYVVAARTRGYAWVDALTVGPSGPPPAGWPPADLPPPPEDLAIGWVATVGETPLWADPDLTLPLGLVPALTPLKQMQPQEGKLLLVQDPYSGAQAYVEAPGVGAIGAPAKVGVSARWWGILAVDGANLRTAPSTKAGGVGQLPSGSPVIVSEWVEGEEVIKDNPTWAKLADGVFLYSATVRPVALPEVPLPPEAAAGLTGRWVDINLTQQVVVAYEQGAPLYLARTSTGRPGWETTPGRYAIQRRVEKETMDSTSLLGLDAQRASYKIENIRWTQYFSADGKALHENYWKPRDEFGIPSSHGCVGLVAEDAKFFWDWAAVGTPLFVHF